MRKFTLLFSLVFTTMVFAQVTTIPSIIQKGYDGEVTIIFNPNEGNKGMVGASKCFAHTGLITSASSNDGDWKNVIDGWRGSSTKGQLTKDGDKWKLVIPNMYEFYGVNKSTEIKKLAFVFHDGPGGSKEGKTAENTDIFVELAEAGLAVSISTAMPEISKKGDEVTLQCFATEAASLSLMLNGKEVLVQEGTELTYTHTFDAEGDYIFSFTATKGDEVKNITAQTCVVSDPVKAARPVGIDMGIYYDEADPTKVTLATYAASKTAPAQHVFVVGDFNDWAISNKYQMKQDGNYFWLEIGGLTPQQEYAMQYVVVREDGVIKKISDLYSEKVLHKDDQWEPSKVNPDLMPYPAKGDGYVTVIQTAKPKFQWSEATLNFKRPDKNNLVIYEAWIYDHTVERTIEGMTNRMYYYEDMGINAIELMPVQEFDGNLNWGYSPNHYFAFDKAYGTPEQLKIFIDECHKRGIAVILDMVFNHATGLNPMNKLYPYGDELKHNPWFNVNAPHGDNVYEDWNHDFEPAHNMFIRVLQYWLTEYKVDGFRLDLSHGLCGTQAGTSVRNIKDYYEKGVKAIAPDAYMILEHWGNNCENDRKELIKEGMLCWDNTTQAYYQTAMGWLKDGDSFSNANRDGYVSYCESHDEERAFFKAKEWGDGDLKTDDQERIGRVPVNMAFLTLLNGPQMFYHFAEFGFDYSKWQNANGQWGKDDSGAAPYGKTGVSNDNYKMQAKARIETWLGEGAWRTAAFHKVGQAIQLRTRLMPQVFEGNPTKVDIGSGKAVRTIQWGSDVFVAGNFSATTEKTVTIPEGKWYNYYEQKEQTETTVTLAPGALMILTGTPQTLPEMQPFYAFSRNTDVENVYIPELPNQILPPYNVTIYTISGQAVSVQRNVEQVNLNGLNHGLYLIQLEKNGQRVTKKVIR
jgi:glycosidase